MKALVQRNQHSLLDQKIRLVYWDIHFDNITVKEKKIVRLIDFERTDLCSIDFVLDVVRRRVEQPMKYISAENEPHVLLDDYQYLLDCYRVYYPSLFDFPT